jgi:hypothetical protein
MALCTGEIGGKPRMYALALPFQQHLPLVNEEDVGGLAAGTCHNRVLHDKRDGHTCTRMHT